MIDTLVFVYELHCPQCHYTTRHDVFMSEEPTAEGYRLLWWAECQENGGEHGHEIAEGPWDLDDL